MNNLEPYLMDDVILLQGVLLKLCEAIQTWPKDHQQPVADCFKRLFAQQFLKDETAEKIMHIIFKEIDYGTEESVGRWYPVFAEGIRSLDWKLYNDKFLPLIKQMVSLSQPPKTRFAAANILSATLNYAAELNSLSKLLSQEYCGLCQDTDISIRLAILNNFPVLLPKVRYEEERDIFVIEILTSLKDSNSEVRSKAIAILVEQQQFFDTEKLKTDFVPELVKEMPEGGTVANCIWSHYSKLVELLINRSLVTADLAKTIHEFFKAKWDSPEVETIKLAVQAIPSMVHLDFSLGVEVFSYESDIIDRLKSADFVATFANTFPNVLNMYHEYSKEYHMKSVFSTIFWHPNTVYAKNMIPSLPSILEQLFSTSKKESDEDSEELEQPLEEAKEVDTELRLKVLTRIKELWAQSNKWPWRDQESFIQTITEIRPFYGIEEYNSYFLDELLTVIKTGNMKIKAAAIRCICDLLTHNYHSKKRIEILGRLIDLAKATSYYERQQFLVFCETALDYFSFSLLKEMGVFDQYLRLAEDKVSNIKLKIIAISIPVWKYVDEDLREELQDKLNNLRNDRNKEVRQFSDIAFSALQAKALEFKKYDPLTTEHNRLREELERNLRIKEEEEEKKRKEEELIAKNGGSDKISGMSLVNKQRGKTGPPQKMPVSKTPKELGAKVIRKPKKLPGPPPPSGGKPGDKQKRGSAPDLVIPYSGQGKRKANGGSSLGPAIKPGARKGK